jgi:erythronate-4-phosphate dehydrogenase
MRLLADENMPLVPEFFAGLGDLRRLPGRSITAADVAAADVLLLRSVTRVDAALLGDSALRFVGTATIGTDHLDLATLAARGVQVASAPGCNARAVGEYVTTVLALLAAEQGWQPSKRTLGVVGLGNTGSQVAALARLLGFRVLGCDPRVSLPGVEARSLPALLEEADILSFHVPLTRQGPHPTFHLMDAGRLARLRPGTLLINSSRGEVIDNAALLAELAKNGRGLTAVLDVWEGEPRLMPALLERVRFGSPHVAGYSQEGKWRGTEMIYRALCATLGRPATLSLQDLQPAGLPEVLVVDAGLPMSQLLAAVLSRACDLARDDAALRASLREPDPALAFDALRKHYPVRREFTAHRVDLPAGHAAWPTLLALGFRPV